jgi:DNA-directed RNA polymerase subunit RPC12/RpoP
MTCSHDFCFAPEADEGQLIIACQNCSFWMVMLTNKPLSKCDTKWAQKVVNLMDQL